MERQVEQAIQRTQRYWYEDGLVEIAAGVVFILLGLLFYIEAVAAPGSLPGSFSAIGLPLLLIGGSEVARQVIRRLKERVTYPRTGYVAYPRPGRRSSGLAFAVGAVIGALAVAVVLSQPLSRSIVPLLQGIVIGGAWAWLGYRLGLPRFLAVAALSALVGLGATYLGLGDSLGSAAYFAAVGIALLISGALALASYLGHTQPAGA